MSEANSSSPLVSVIVPVYNGAGSIADTLCSIRRQTFTDYELIVVNDGSTDNTVEIIREIAPNAIIVNQSNCGLAATRNHGVAIARGKWVTFLDADDLWHTGRLQSLVDFAAENPDCSALGTTAVKFCLEEHEAELKRIGDWSDIAVKRGKLEEQLVMNPTYAKKPTLVRKVDNTDFLAGNCILSSGVLIDRILLARAGLFPMHMSVSEDYFCWINVAKITPIWLVDCPNWFYRVDAKSMSRTRDMDTPILIQLLSHWYAGRRNPRKNPSDVKDLESAAKYYIDWNFSQLITNAIRAGDGWRIGASLRLAYFLLPKSQRWKLRSMIIKAYAKKHLLSWRHRPSSPPAQKAPPPVRLSTALEQK